MRRSTRAAAVSLSRAALTSAPPPPLRPPGCSLSRLLELLPAALGCRPLDADLRGFAWACAKKLAKAGILAFSAAPSVGTDAAGRRAAAALPRRAARVRSLMRALQLRRPCCRGHRAPGAPRVLVPTTAPSQACRLSVQEALAHDHVSLASLDAARALNAGAGVTLTVRLLLHSPRRPFFVLTSVAKQF